MAKFLVVVDMQNDFIDGSLGTKEAQDIVEKVMAKVENFSGEVIFTRDTHDEYYLSTQEGQNLPVRHCLKGTEGWQLQKDLALFCQRHSCKVFDKPSFSSLGLAYYLLEKQKEETIDAIELLGLCTDICVVSNALVLKAFLPEVPLLLYAQCCAGVTPESHKQAIEVMKKCQIQVLE